MNSRDLVRQALRGETTPRIPTGPLAVHFCARRAGVSLRDYTLDARALADCVVRYWEHFRPDAVWLSADTWVTAEAMGAAVAFPGEGQPLGGTGEPLVKSAADLDAIPPADPSRQGRQPLMQEALRLVRRELGEEVFVVACFDQSPFTLACALLGMDRMMLTLYDDPPLVEALLERCVEYGAAYGAALGECGADLLSTGDSAAGLIGPRFYREVALPAEQRLFAELRARTETPFSLHICGDATAILPDMASSGANVLEIDHQVDLGEACRLVPERIALWGNLDPVGVLERGSEEEVERAVAEALHVVRESGRKRFVLSSGCTLALDTPEENLRAFLRCKWRYRYRAR